VKLLEISWAVDCGGKKSFASGVFLPPGDGCDCEGDDGACSGTANVDVAEMAAGRRRGRSAKPISAAAKT